MSDFSSIDSAISGATVNLGNTTPTALGGVVVDAITGNPLNAVTNIGTLGSGIPSGSLFGDNIIGRIGSGDNSLGGIINSVVNDPSSSRYSSSSKSMTDTDKRLNTIRSRAAKTLYTNASASSYTSDRGPIAYIRLLKNDAYDPSSSVQDGTQVNASAELSQLLSKQTGTGFTSFMLTDINMQHSEKTQILTTFGDNEVVYYFGKQPLIVSLSGLLFDSIEADWFSKFILLYQRVLRGTQLARNYALVEITLPNLKLTGTISSLGHQQNSARDTDIPFTMQFIAKEVEPLPVQAVSGSAKNMVGNLIDFNATRSGTASWVYSLASGSIGGGFMDTVTSAGGLLGGISDTIGGISSAISGAIGAFRTSIFSPIYGVVSSITKIIKTVTGSISKIISSFCNPLNQILRDITTFARAGSLVNLIENSINSIFAIPNRTIANYNTMIRSLKKSAGAMTRFPEDISQIFKREFSRGTLKKGCYILSSGKKRKKSKAAVLSSGAPYNPSQSAQMASRA